jgi:hypothetical protein
LAHGFWEFRPRFLLYVSLAEHHKGWTAWRRKLFNSWQAGSREREYRRGQGKAIPLSLVTYFFWLGPTF